LLNEEELRKEIESFVNIESDTVRSSEFNEFKKEATPLKHNLYEKACNFSEKVFAIKPDKKNYADLQEALETCHINATPTGATSFSLLFPFIFIVVMATISFFISMIFLEGESLTFLVGSMVLFGILLIIPLSKYPRVLATGWRMRSSNQMVLSVFYLVSFMRHTSNLELAMKFTSEHIAPPLSLDFKKIIWNVESAKFNSLKESLDNYLDSWKKYNMEYVESMHLVESSLYEPKENRRIDMLEKGLSLILESTYEKMLHFAQELKSPLEMLHMLGVILPILGLVILPLIFSFMNSVRWYHIAMLYNLFLPAIVYYLGKSILSTRPTGYGQADITEVNPELKKHTMINLKLGSKDLVIHPKYVAIFIFAIFFIIFISPLVIHAMNDEMFDYVLIKEPGAGYKLISTANKEELNEARFKFLGYRKDDETLEVKGPFGLGATLLSIALPLGLGRAFGYYYNARTKKLMKIREETKKLEDEFAATLFQLGNRIGDGLPPELAFSKVAEQMHNTNSGGFFELASKNISTLGMGVEEAIFDKKRGAINKYPSALIKSSMKVFVESARKGPEVASRALINISTYIKEMHRVDERLRDLLAEITSSMSSQIKFLAPLISGIVVGLTSMITAILDKLGTQLEGISEGVGGGGLASNDFLATLGNGIPTYFFQAIVGIYVIQIVYLLTTMLNVIQSGYDPLNEKHMLGENLKHSGTFYSMLAFIIILVFNLIASAVVNSPIISGR